VRPIDVTRRSAAAKWAIITVIVLCFPAAFALSQKQAPVDLSGTWRLNRDKSKTVASDSARSDIVTISCAGSTVRIDFPHGSETSYTFIADGKERHATTDPALPRYLKASWKKGSLVTETIVRVTVPYPWEPVHTKDRWTLSSDGRVLSREIDDPKRILVYDKQ
jgi:hypothetical protein